jgi:hypothetical protein
MLECVSAECSTHLYCSIEGESGDMADRETDEVLTGAYAPAAKTTTTSSQIDTTG